VHSRCAFWLYRTQGTLAGCRRSGSPRATRSGTPWGLSTRSLLPPGALRWAAAACFAQPATHSCAAHMTRALHIHAQPDGLSGAKAASQWPLASGGPTMGLHPHPCHAQEQSQCMICFEEQPMTSMRTAVCGQHYFCKVRRPVTCAARTSAGGSLAGWRLPIPVMAPKRSASTSPEPSTSSSVSTSGEPGGPATEAALGSPLRTGQPRRPTASGTRTDPGSPPLVLAVQDCWRGYIQEALSSGPSCLDLRCPSPECKPKAFVSGLGQP
jgi:hypothetical protein